MGILKKKSIAALSTALIAAEGKSYGMSNSNLNGLKTLTEAYLNTPNKKQRQKLAEDFKARQLELNTFFKDNPELLNAEVEKALLMAAVGGEYEETEIRIGSGGKKSVKRVKKQIQPNVAAASKWLNNRNPEEWSDKPAADPELEDTSDIEEDIYGKDN